MSAFDPKQTLAAPKSRNEALWNVSQQRSRLFYLDVGGADHLGPLLGFSGDELAELGGRHRNRGAAEVREPLFDRRIGESSVDLTVELLDNFGGRIPGRTDTEKPASVVAGQEFTHRWDVRQHRRPRRGCDRQRAQLTRSDVANRLKYWSKHNLHLSTEQIEQSLRRDRPPELI